MLLRIIIIIDVHRQHTGRMIGHPSFANMKIDHQLVDWKMCHKNYIQ